ncbi:hypothetical protein GRI40_12305 [Altererythrobacter aerius]|uniref:META domain-containing protein n=1 Tax=Tsuneonella aeria TaxID=1837929 RepID=A0A6I4THL9_9SPHN|nr:hypothetical protein [Tsuneonella aeria]MXO75998.1 hypothetical protein [Tsuneonella aeria]
MRLRVFALPMLLAATLAGCKTSEGPTVGTAAALPPPPPGQFAPMTDAVRELYGEWRPLSGPGVSEMDRLTIWSPMFSWGSGCNVSQGQLRDLGENRFTIEHGFGGLPENCRSLSPLAPFDGADVAITMPDSETLRVERGGETWLFAKVDVAGTHPSEDFIRGEWLLADMRGRPYRGDELTRVTFGSEYRVDAANCSVATNAWFSDRDWEVRVAGSYVRFSDRCRTRTLGDRLAKLGTAASYRAEPVETRMTLQIAGHRATLVPASRFPELAGDAEAIPPHPWAQELAQAAARLEGEKRDALALRAVGLGGEGSPEVETPADPRRLAFSGLTAWQHAQALEAGLLPAPLDPPEGLRQHLASAPIVALAALEGIRPVDRGDGLSLDYLYRVRESWRGGQRAGDLLIVRMPPLEGKSRSPLITPAPGDEVLLLASRSGYIAGRLFEGNPPSADTRVVQMTLPLMRIVEGKLAEAVDGANVLGAAGFAGTSVDDARELARSVEEGMKAIAPPRPVDNFGNPTVRRYFITKIGERELPDPTRLWIEYVFGAPRGNGGVTAYFDGCTPVSRQLHLGEGIWAASAVACPGKLPNGAPITEPAVAEAVRWIEDNYFPDIICVSTCPKDPEYTVPLPGGEVIMRAMLQ